MLNNYICDQFLNPFWSDSNQFSPSLLTHAHTEQKYSEQSKNLHLIVIPLLIQMFNP